MMCRGCNRRIPRMAYLSYTCQSLGGKSIRVNNFLWRFLDPSYTAKSVVRPFASGDDVISCSKQSMTLLCPSGKKAALPWRWRMRVD